MKLKVLLLFRYYCILFSALLFGCSGSSNESTTSEWETKPADEIPEQKDPDIPVAELPFDRTTWQNPTFVIDQLGPVRGSRVADIGAGMGYFTFLLAELGATVVAIDIEPEFLDYIQNRRDASEVFTPQMIETRLSDPSDPLLAEEEVDKALLVNTYSFLTDRIDYLRKIDKGMKDDGILCVVDYKSEDVPVISTKTPVIEVAVVKEELQSAGFRVLNIDTASLEFQYIITATPN